MGAVASTAQMLSSTVRTHKRLTTPYTHGKRSCRFWTSFHHVETVTASPLSFPRIILQTGAVLTGQLKESKEKFSSYAVWTFLF